MLKKHLSLSSFFVILLFYGVGNADNQTRNLNKSLTASDAEQLVWQIPEVKHLQELIRTKGAIPFTMQDSYSENESKQNHFSIFFGEDHGTHSVRVATFLVDNRTGKISGYDVVTDTVVPFAQWQAEWKPLITMKRTMCYGQCPVYSLIIRQNALLNIRANSL